MGSNEFGAASGHRLVTMFGHRIVCSTFATAIPLSAILS